MEWAERTENNLTIISLNGDIDLHHSPALRSVLQTKIQSKCPALLLDFTGVGYIDSSGLATLVEYFQASRPFQGRIALASLSARVKSVFELVRLSEIFPIHASVDEARASLNS